MSLERIGEEQKEIGFDSSKTAMMSGKPEKFHKESELTEKESAQAVKKAATTFLTLLGGKDSDLTLLTGEVNLRIKFKFSSLDKQKFSQFSLSESIDDKKNDEVMSIQAEEDEAEMTAEANPPSKMEEKTVQQTAEQVKQVMENYPSTKA